MQATKLLHCFYVKHHSKMFNFGVPFKIKVWKDMRVMTNVHFVWTISSSAQMAEALSFVGSIFRFRINQSISEPPSIFFHCNENILYSSQTGCTVLYLILLNHFIDEDTSRHTLWEEQQSAVQFPNDKDWKNPFLDISYSSFESSRRACGLTTKQFVRFLWVLSVSSWIDSLQLCIFLYRLYLYR